MKSLQTKITWDWSTKRKYIEVLDSLDNFRIIKDRGNLNDQSKILFGWNVLERSSNLWYNDFCTDYHLYLVFYLDQL